MTSDATLVETAQAMDTLGPLDKLVTADYARLMGDNQRVLTLAAKRAEAFARYEAKQMGEKITQGEDDMHVSIDSPVTTTHHHLPPTPPSGGIGKALAGAAIATALLGIPGAGLAGYFASQLRSTTPAPITAPKPTTDESLDIGLGRFSDLKSEISNLK